MGHVNQEHIVVCRTPHRHLAFPDACLLASGELVVVFREGDRHVDPSGKIVMCRSSNPNCSLTFGPSETICDTNLDDRDPSVFQHSSGILMVNFFRLDMDQGCLHLSLIESGDDGNHWGRPRDIEVPGFSKGLATSDAIVEMPSGELVMPVYGISDHGENGSFVIRSTDQGNTWNEIFPLAVSPSPVFEEPALGLMPDGTLQAFLRTDQKGLGFIYHTYSFDGGRSWASPERLSLWGYPSDLLVLPDQKLLATYGYRQFPTGIRSCAGRFNSAWSVKDEHILRCDGHDEGELGYPSSVWLGHEQVLTVYYFTDGEGGEPYIAGTRYRILEGGGCG